MEDKIEWVIWQEEGELFLTNVEFSKNKNIIEGFDSFQEASNALKFYQDFLIKINQF